VELPDLTRVVDTYVPVTSKNYPDYIKQLKRDLLPHVRKLQSDGHIRWFSFLVHDATQLGGREPNDGRFFIHIRLEPSTELDFGEFVKLLPNHFLNPKRDSLSHISGLDGAKFRNDDWAHAWKIHGEASEWVLFLLEGHKDEPTLKHLTQFMHFITNPLMQGHKFACISSRSTF